MLHIHCVMPREIRIRVLRTSLSKAAEYGRQFVTTKHEMEPGDIVILRVPPEREEVARGRVVRSAEWEEYLAFSRFCRFVPASRNRRPHCYEVTFD